MLRNVIETNREILTDVSLMKVSKTTHTASPCDKSAAVYEEVGVAHSSVETSVMERGAKEPYLVDVNREVRVETRRRCDG